MEVQGGAKGFDSGAMEARLSLLREQCIQVQEAVGAFERIVGTNSDFKDADSKLIALIAVENDHAAPESLTDAEIKPEDPCAKFEDDSLLVWQRWDSGGMGQALFYFDLYFHDTPATWKRCAQCKHRTHEYGGVVLVLLTASNTSSSTSNKHQTNQ